MIVATKIHILDEIIIEQNKRDRCLNVKIAL